MTTQASIHTGNHQPNSDQIADFLRSQPKFFNDHPELLTELRLPHPSGKAVSLLERQLQLLREQNNELKDRLMRLVDVARENDRVNERMHTLMMDLLGSGSAIELLDRLEDHLRNDFHADTISIHLSTGNEMLQRETSVHKLGPNEAIKKMFARPLLENTPLCGRLSNDQLQFLFGDQAVAIESAAVIPLGDAVHPGLLAIGSREISRFHCDLGTLFLKHLGELVNGLLKNHGIG